MSPTLCKGRPRAQEVILATSGVGGMVGESFYLPVPLLTKEGSQTNYGMTSEAGRDNGMTASGDSCTSQRYSHSIQRCG